MIKWTIDPEGVRKARRILGIKHGVKIQLIDDPDWWGGWQAPLHQIDLSIYIQDPLDASDTVWHELAHGMQCERDYGSDGKAFISATSHLYTPFIDHDGEKLCDAADYDSWYDEYIQLPLEQEAEQIALRYGGRIPLVR